MGCITLALLLLLAIGATVGMAPGRASDEPPATVTVTRTVTSAYHGKTAEHWAWRYKNRTRQLAAARAMTHRLIVHKWQPTVFYAFRLASAIFGVPVTELATVSHCESTYNPFATNGRYKGVFQLGWSPFGMSPFDPVANVLSAAATVAHDGSWRQWQCKP